MLYRVHMKYTVEYIAIGHVYVLYSALLPCAMIYALCDIEQIMKIRKSKIKFRGSIARGPMRK